MKFKRMISLLLIISIIFLSVIGMLSCVDNTKENNVVNNQNAENENNNAKESSPTKETDPKEQYKPDFEPVDMQGYVFKFGTRDGNVPVHAGVPVHTRDLYAEVENGDLINDAVYKRNRYIEEKYNCVITMDAFPENNETIANQVVEKSAKVGDKSYDLLLTHMLYGINTALKGCFYDIVQFPNIDISKPYWNHGANEGCSIGNKLYIGLSDLSFSTNENLYCIFFNKTLTKNYNVENPYQLVNDNQWTFDKFNEIIKVGYEDLNGDGKSDKNDRFGYVSSNALNFLWSGGSHMTIKNEDDIPVLDFLNERTITIYEKALNITKNNYTFSVGEWYKEPAIQIFQEGRGVFYSSQLCRVNDLRATEFDFGIVPYPKLDSA